MIVFPFLFQMSLNKPTTIDDIKSSPVPNSPQRCSKKLTCAVLNKSPLRLTKNGSMFSLNLCDNQPSSTIRAVCFNKDMFPNFETNVTYDLESFKLKKAFGNSSSLELLLDRDTKVSTATSQLTVADHTFNISQILRNETENIRFINLKARVTSIGDPILVGTFPDNKTKRTIYLADNTGHIELVLWRERAENIEFGKGDVLSLQNVVLSTFNNQLSVTSSFETVITTLNEEMTVASTQHPLPKSNVVSLETFIVAIKEFICTYTCIDCRKQIDPGAYMESPTITCPTCSTMFLKESTQLSNHCMVRLNNKQWFSANTGVSI